MKRAAILLGAILAFAALPALAQNANAINVFGVVEKIDDGSITVKKTDGASETYKLSPKLLVLQNKPTTLDDIKPNEFVASAAARGADGKLHSTELRIYPEVLRGIGEGQRPMNDPKNQTMTNANVTGTAIVNGSNVIKVSFTGGESELILDPGVPVTRIVVVDKALVTAGAKVRVQGPTGPDGVVIGRITLQ